MYAIGRWTNFKTAKLMCTVIVYKQLLDLMFHLLVVVLNMIGTYKCDLYSIYIHLLFVYLLNWIGTKYNTQITCWIRPTKLNITILQQQEDPCHRRTLENLRTKLLLYCHYIDYASKERKAINEVWYWMQFDWKKGLSIS